MCSSASARALPIHSGRPSSFLPYIWNDFVFVPIDCQTIERLWHWLWRFVLGCHLHLAAYYFYMLASARTRPICDVHRANVCVCVIWLGNRFRATHIRTADTARDVSALHFFCSAGRSIVFCRSIVVCDECVQRERRRSMCVFKTVGICLRMRTAKIALRRFVRRMYRRAHTYLRIQYCLAVG